MAEMDTVTIYVYLLDEGVDVWRPVEATQIRENIYWIISENENPDDETWEFSKDDIVRCREKRLTNGLHLIAVEKA